MQRFLTEKIARYLRWFFLCILFLAFYTYFFSLNKFHLFYLEQTQLFRFSGDYFKPFIEKPGEFIFYIGEFLSLYFVYPILSTGIVIIWTATICFHSKIIFINSGIQTKRFHMGSSNNGWLNKLSLRPYFSHMDDRGTFSKPFILPQKDPLFYDRFLKSFNIPELVRSKVNLDPRNISGEMSKKPIKVKFSSKF